MTGLDGRLEEKETRTRVAAAVVFREGRMLLTQRPPGGDLGLQWEFPGGKIEPGESAEQALAREIREELGVRAVPGERLGVHRHDYPNGLRVEIVFVRCELETDLFTPGAAVNAVRWVRPSEVDPEELLAADREFLRALCRVNVV